MLRDDGHEASAADGPACSQVDRGEWPFRAGLGGRQGGLHPALQPGRVLLAHDRPAPERRIEGDEREVSQVVASERFEPDPLPLQDDRLDPGLYRHVWNGIRRRGGGRGQGRGHRGT